MTLKTVTYSMIYLLLFISFVFVGIEMKSKIDKAKLTQSIEPQIIYGTVEELE